MLVIDLSIPVIFLLLIFLVCNFLGLLITLSYFVCACQSVDLAPSLDLMLLKQQIFVA
jgi:hypothetical protein